MNTNGKTFLHFGGLDGAVLLRETRTAPIIYMVHGRAGDRDVMWAFRRSAPETFTLVTPQAPHPDPIGGFSWWQVQPQPDGIEVAVAGSQALLQFCVEFEASNQLSPSTRIAIGFSQGAAVISLAMQHDPTFFHGVGLLAGFFLQHPESEGFRTAVRKPEVFIAHGSRDETIPIERAQAGYQLLESWGVEVDFHEDPVGHKVGSTGMRALKEWLFSFS